MGAEAEIVLVEEGLYPLYNRRPSNLIQVVLETTALISCAGPYLPVRNTM